MAARLLGCGVRGSEKRSAAGLTIVVSRAVLLVLFAGSSPAEATVAEKVTVVFSVVVVEGTLPPGWSEPVVVTTQPVDRDHA